MRLALVPLFIALASPLAAQPRDNPQIDYRGFQALAQNVAPLRQSRLIGLSRFQAEAANPRTLILDARSREAFDAGHIEGAVNLPFSDFTAESLAAAIGPDRERPILIYCNNNFRNNAPPVTRNTICHNQGATKDLRC